MTAKNTTKAEVKATTATKEAKVKKDKRKKTQAGTPAVYAHRVIGIGEVLFAGSDGSAKAIKVLTATVAKVGKKLNLKDYTDAKVQADMKDADMTKAITYGVFADGKEKMKAFKDEFSADDIKDLVGYVRKFKG